MASVQRHLGFQERADFFRRHRLFCDVGDDALRHLASGAAQRTVKRNSLLFSKGDPGDSLVGVVSGNVKISVVAPDGKELLFAVMREGDLFGEIAVLDGAPRSADATTMCDCELLFIRRSEILGMLRHEPEVALTIIKVLCERVRRISEHAEDIIFLDAQGRLAKAIMRLVDEEPADNKDVARLRVTQEEISQIVGLSREMTNRQLREWARLKVVRLGRGSIEILQRDFLAKLSGHFAAEDHETDSRRPTMP